VEGNLDNTVCAIDSPVSGTVKVLSSEYKIASIDLQLVRKEEVMLAGKTASDISEVQVRRMHQTKLLTSPSNRAAASARCHSMRLLHALLLPH
jgi:hypothetical protein